MFLPGAGLDLKMLNAWCAMPGWASATEAVHRGRYHASSEKEVSSTGIVAARVLSVLVDLGSLSVSAHLSLAATVRKLMWPYIQGETHMQAQERQKLWAEQPGQQVLWIRRHLKVLTDFQLPVLMTAMIAAVSHLSSLHAAVGHAIGGSSTDMSRGSGNTASYIDGADIDMGNGLAPLDKSSSSASNIISSGTSGRLGKTLESGHLVGLNFDQRADVEVGAVQTSAKANANNERQAEGEGGSRYVGRGKGVLDARSGPFLLHRLQAGTVFTLMQLCLFMMECQKGGEEYRKMCSQCAWWLEPLQQVCKQLPYRGLMDIVSAVLADISHSVTSLQPALDARWDMWAGYAATHFHGRLFPGCCHLGCPNLDGISEAGLDTQLCSGCRMARYCCMRCQKAAWLEGGHNAVCGK